MHTSKVHQKVTTRADTHFKSAKQKLGVFSFVFVGGKDSRLGFGGGKKEEKKLELLIVRVFGAAEIRPGATD